MEKTTPSPPGTATTPGIQPSVTAPGMHLDDGNACESATSAEQPARASMSRTASVSPRPAISKVEDAFRRAAEKQRQEAISRFKKQDLGTNYSNADFESKPSPPTVRSNLQQGEGPQQYQQTPPRRNMPRRTSAAAVQRGRGVNGPGHQSSSHHNSGDSNSGHSQGRRRRDSTKKTTGGPRPHKDDPSVLEEEAGDLDAEDAIQTQLPLPGESRHLQKQIHLERKKKELEDLLSSRPTGPYKRQAAPQAELFPSSAGPLSVADLRRIAAERLQQNATNMPVDPFVDYKELHRAQRHNRMNLLKTKKAARQERLFGKKKAPVTVIHEIKIPHNGLTLREVAQRLSMKISDVVERFAALGETITEDADDLLLDSDVVELLALELGLEVVRQEAIYTDAEQYIKSKARATVVNDSELTPRIPVVSIMGHVDHGKTTLLDFLRHNTTLTAVAGKEAGGITQRLSAFNVEIGDRKAVVLDTPGHAAFSSMRRKGSIASDIVVLVVAVDDGVRPQTIEAIKMAKKGGCVIVVFLNKIDKFTSNSEREAARRRVLGQLVECDVTAEEFGGDVQVVEASAKTGEGVDSLVEQLLFQADLMDLKGYTKGPAEAVVLDAKMEQGRGVVVDVLVKWGVLKVGDPVVVNTSYGRVRSLLDENGKSIKSAGPSTPVRIMGLKTVPVAGQDLLALSDEGIARKIAGRRQKVEDTKRINGINRWAQEMANSANPVVVRVVLKADSTGALNALRNIVDSLGERADEVCAHVIGQSVGDVNPSDISLAAMSDDGEHATILGFNIREPTGSVRALMKQHDVNVIQSDVVYRLEEALEGLMEEHMPVERHMTLEGVATVLQLFDYKAKHVLKVAGLHVTSGVLRTSKNHIFRVKREASKVPAPEGADPLVLDEQGYVTILEESAEAHLKRFKDTVDEVKSGLECGISIDDYSNFMSGDIIECCKVENKFKSLVVQKYTQEMQYGRQMREGGLAEGGDSDGDNDT